MTHEALALINKCREQGVTLTPTPHGTLRVAPASKLTEELREELKRHKPTILAFLRQQQKHPPLSLEEREFLTRFARNLPWEESPGWEAIQVLLRPLGAYVWLVRVRAAAEQYAGPGVPALVLSEAAACRWQTLPEARQALLPLLIMGGVQ